MVRPSARRSASTSASSRPTTSGMVISSSGTTVGVEVGLGVDTGGMAMGVGGGVAAVYCLYRYTSPVTKMAKTRSPMMMPVQVVAVC